MTHFHWFYLTYKIDDEILTAAETIELFIENNDLYLYSSKE